MVPGDHHPPDPFRAGRPVYFRRYHERTRDEMHELPGSAAVRGLVPWCVPPTTPRARRPRDRPARCRRYIVRCLGSRCLRSWTTLPKSCCSWSTALLCKHRSGSSKTQKKQREEDETTFDQRGSRALLRWLGRFGGVRGSGTDESVEYRPRGDGSREIRNSGRCIESRRDGEPPPALPATKE